MSNPVVGGIASTVLLLGLCAEAAAAFLSQFTPDARPGCRAGLRYADPDEAVDPIVAAGPPRDVFRNGANRVRRNDVGVPSREEGIEDRYSLASRLHVGDAPSERGPDRPVRVIGHRGSPYTALENTSRGFVHAALAGADGVELDVFLLKCGTLVVFHGSGGDENPGLLHSYCGVEGSILDYTAEEARDLLTFNKHFDEFGCGPREITHPGEGGHYCYVHTLEEVLATLRDRPDVPPGFQITIELKGPGTAAPALELVRKMGMERRCRYSSFDHARVAEVRRLDADAVSGALFASDVPDDFVARCVAAGADEVHLRYDTCTRERVREAHDAGLGTMAWFRGPAGMRDDCLHRYLDVGNEDADMYRTVLASGVGSVCVNRPGALVRALEGDSRRMRGLPRV